MTHSGVTQLGGPGQDSQLGQRASGSMPTTIPGCPRELPSGTALTQRPTPQSHIPHSESEHHDAREGAEAPRQVVLASQGPSAGLRDRVGLPPVLSREKGATRASNKNISGPLLAPPKQAARARGSQAN